MNYMKQELLKGRAEFSIHRNDMHWSCCILNNLGDGYEFYHIRWSGYNDDYWWDRISEKASVKECVSDKGNKKRFKLNYQTLDVEEVKE